MTATAQAAESDSVSEAAERAERADTVTPRWACWTWVPSLYFAEGLPYVMVMTVSVLMYKRLGVSNTDLAFYTGWLYLPWVIKPLWSPLVDVLGTQRRWVLLTQALISGALFGVAVATPQSGFFFWTLGCFWVMAIGSATHDIAADGFYMTGLSTKDQAWFVGIRSTFYRAALIAGNGLLVMLAGALEHRMEIDQAWGISFGVVAGLFTVMTVYHAFALPRPPSPERRGASTAAGVFADFGETFASFFKKPGLGMALAFLLMYRFAEAQLVRLTGPFMLDETETGGLQLATETVGWMYGTVGVGLLTLGGILGGIVVARDGLKPWLLPMALAINLPNAVYVYLAFYQPTSHGVIASAVALEQFGYGFGFAAYMLYMLHLSRGEHQTAHYAICTGFMALGMMIPGMFCGMIQEELGYRWFFVWVLVATVPSLLITSLLPVREQADPSQEATQ